jgi:hypothetical protein
MTFTLSAAGLFWIGCSAFNAYAGIAVDVVCFFMGLLSFRGISTPSLMAQGEQRRSFLFNIPRDIPFVVMRKLQEIGGAALWRGFEG